MSWQFGALKMFGYQVLAIDPPWPFELRSEAGNEKSASAQYRTMTLHEISALRVGELARGDCLLLLWSTTCLIPRAIAVMESWGFAYKSEIVWRKVTKNGKPRMGTGYRVRSMHEPVLLGTLGNPEHKPFPSVFDGVAREHSRKPQSFYDLVERCAPKLSFRADVFSRETRAGWDSFGDECGKFDRMPPPAVARQAAAPQTCFPEGAVR
jgi:N6-adenosine-specific RNA methylase IME4